VAEVFWIKDGTPGNHPASDPARVPIDTLEEKLVPYEKRYYDAPPSFNAASGPSRKEAPFLHVLVRVGEKEIDEVFPEAGYYHIVHLAPHECAELLGLPPPPGAPAQWHDPP
jgi:hypothetical protein